MALHCAKLAPNQKTSILAPQLCRVTPKKERKLHQHTILLQLKPYFRTLTHPTPLNLTQKTYTLKMKPQTHCSITTHSKPNPKSFPFIFMFNQHLLLFPSTLFNFFHFLLHPSSMADINLWCPIVQDDYLKIK